MTPTYTSKADSNQTVAVEVSWQPRIMAPGCTYGHKVGQLRTAIVIMDAEAAADDFRRRSIARGVIQREDGWRGPINC